MARILSPISSYAFCQVNYCTWNFSTQKIVLLPYLTKTHWWCNVLPKLYRAQNLSVATFTWNVNRTNKQFHISLAVHFMILFCTRIHKILSNKIIIQPKHYFIFGSHTTVLLIEGSVGIGHRNNILLRQNTKHKSNLKKMIFINNLRKC